jgi:hypothetical protein
MVLAQGLGDADCQASRDEKGDRGLARRLACQRGEERPLHCDNPLHISLPKMTGWGAVAIWLTRMVNEPRYTVEASPAISRGISANCAYWATIYP